MSTFADAAVKAAVRARIAGLKPDASRQWGKMTPHQMVCHLSDAYRMAAGMRNSKPMDNFFSRNIVRRIALHTNMSWPKGVKTLPEADQQQGGTKPVGWDTDIAELLRLVDGWAAKEGHAHPFFGPLTSALMSPW